MAETYRVSRTAYDLAGNVRDVARVHGDEMIIDACNRVRAAYLHGIQADGTDLRAVRAFADTMEEVA